MSDRQYNYKDFKKSSWTESKGVWKKIIKNKFKTKIKQQYINITDNNLKCNDGPKDEKGQGKDWEDMQEIILKY